MINDGQNGGSANATLTNVTFSNNTSLGSGGAIHNYGFNGGTSNPVLKNVILWGDTAAGEGPKST